MVEQLAKQHSQLETMVRKEYHLSDPESTTAVTAKNSSSAAATGMSSPARNSGSAGNSSSSASAKKNEDAAKKKVAPDGSGDRHHRQDVRSVTSGSGSDDEDEFEDAMDTENHLQIWVTAPPHANSEAGSKDDDVSDEETENSAPGERIAVYMTKSPAVPKSAASALSRNESDGCSSSRKSLSCDLDEIDASSSSGAASASPGAAQKKKSLRERRVRIPDKPNISISLWGIVKNSIGKDLTKIPVPVNFSEPLSMLQRLTEDFEYNEILDQAAAATDNCEQMAYVAAFSVSAYSTTAVRSSKPFNPLLGEFP